MTDIINNILNNDHYNFKVKAHNYNSLEKGNIIDLIAQYLFSKKITDDTGFIMIYNLLNDDHSVLKTKNVNITLAELKTHGCEMTRKALILFRKISILQNTLVLNIKHFKITEGTSKQLFCKNISVDEFIGLIILKVMPMLKSFYNSTLTRYITMELKKIRRREKKIKDAKESTKQNDDEQWIITHESMVVGLMKDVVKYFGINLLKWLNVPLIPAQQFMEAPLENKVSIFEKTCNIIQTSLIKINGHHNDMNNIKKGMDDLFEKLTHHVKLNKDQLKTETDIPSDSQSEATKKDQLYNDPVTFFPDEDIPSKIKKNSINVELIDHIINNVVQ